MKHRRTIREMLRRHRGEPIRSIKCRRHGLFIFPAIAACLLLLSCQKKVSILVVAQKPEEVMGQAEKTLQGLYQNFWTPPSSDAETLTVGVVASAATIELRAPQEMQMKVYSDREPFQISSPPNVAWSIKATEIVKPAVATYLPVVEVRLFPRTKNITSSSQNFWKQHGFKEIQWIGPSASVQPSVLQRWVLSLSGAIEKSEAQSFCLKARKLNEFCKVIALPSSPPVLKGTISTLDGSFSTDFEGFVEITSSHGPIEVLNFMPEPRTQKTNAENYAPPLYAIPLANKEISLVQKTNLRNYLNTVVPSEIFPQASLEAVKAQAVAARTYVLRHLPEDGAIRPYTICASTNCQVYRGMDKAHPHSTQAVEETDSMILWSDEGQPAETFYHGLCAGTTEDKSVVRGPPSQSYLAGSPDTRDGSVVDLSSESAVQAYFKMNNKQAYYCGSSTYTNPERWRWTKTIDAKMVEKILENLGLKGPLTHVRVLRRGKSGRALSVEFTTPSKAKVVTDELKIRMLFDGLLSSLISIEPIKDATGITSLNITGAGYGHGIGMCQVGAIGRAEAGQKVDEILQAYYPGTILSPIMVQ